MLKLFIILTFVTNLNYVLSDSSENDKAEAIASAIAVAQTSGTSSSSATSSATAYSSATVTSSNKCTSTETKCGKNQVYDLCPSSCPPRTCATKDILINCITPLKPGDPKCPPPKCRCADNFYSNDQGECVSKEKCPTKTCSINEEYVSCPVPSCAAQTCENIGKKFSCPAIPADYPCKGECRCKPGYYRNKVGQCISEAQCQQCGKNETFDLCPPTYPPMTCATKGIAFRSRASPKPGDDECPPPKCRCAPNYYRTDDGQCVLKEECPAETCGVNEVYLPCPNPPCPSQTCENIGLVFPCPAPPPNDPCKGECRCKDGYYRNEIGQCISESECTQCGKNQVYDLCPVSCPPRTCATKDAEFKCLAPLKPGDPKCPPPKCRCADNFYSNDQRECVPKEECPSKTCGTNEIYVSCPKPTCSNQTCEEIGKIINCPLLPVNYPCKGECQCKPGYYRNKVGRCISEADCKKCTRENEYFDCDNACDNICAKLSEYTHADCPILNIVCNPMCYCVEGYARDANGKCIPISQCPPPKCGKNQVPTDCANSPCLRTCATKDLNIQCKPYPPGCKPGCKCADGYLKDDKGICVPIDKCPPKKPRCGKNETISDCPNQECRAQKCSEVGFPLACDQLAQNNTDCGKPACICKPGFVRNEHNVCIDAKDCPSCGGDVNAVTGCGTFCTRCDNYKKKGRICPEFCLKNGCECRPNYVFDSRTKKCVLPKDCFNEVCPDPNEYLDKCSTNCPDPECGIGVIPTFAPCTRPSNPADCVARCRCKDGYYRNADYKCIKKEECPPTCGPNEVPSDCGNNGCLPTCAEPERLTYCSYNPELCEPGCVCADGYLRNGKGVCVPKDKCPSAPQCGLNEAPSDCGNNGCLPTCAEPERLTYCSYNPELCEPGCVCADGYLRNGKGVCVPKDKCPSAPQCGLNEAPSDCGNNGCLPTCAEPERLTYCSYNPELCEPGCVCAEGYLRDDKDVCVPKDKCPSEQNVCLLPPEQGRCKALIPRFYYDSCKKDCLKFTYGGCGGNGNNFNTKEECLKKCACNKK